MDPIDTEPRPGTALKTMIKEAQYMDEFMLMIRKKLDIEERYLNDLKALRETCNPQWLESGVRDLISPTLTLFANEITHLANRHMKNADKVSQAVEAANQPTNREGFLPAVKISEPLEAAYKEHHSAHTELVDKESLDELTRWYASDEPVFPFKERRYRSAVVNQQRAVERLNSWYSTGMQVTLEVHQQRAEELKRMLLGMATSYNEFVTNLSRAGSSALASTNDFASTTFIAPRHEEVDLEITHTLLRKVKYHNYITNEVGSQPIFGLGTAETIELVRGLMAEILYKMAPFSLSREMYANTIFALEREFAQLQKEGDIIMKRKAIECAFISEPPMIPISYDVISQYSGGVPREKLGTILGGISPNGRRNVLEFAIQMVDWFKRAHHEDAFAGPAQHLMYGKNSTSIIMRDIWRKWDIEKDIPFPEGVERMWNKETKKSEVLYAKTRLPYVS